MSPIFTRSLPFGLYIALLALEGLLPDWVPDFDLPAGGVSGERSHRL
ncbi:MAG TPA: hypothetical protein VMV78_16500 [Thiobacillus sp.]|jgi:hypothetical protein|nr:hypothetical protein [Thiobacillus sp.]